MLTARCLIFSLDLGVANGIISYPSLPEQIRNISLESVVFFNGTDNDKTTIDVKDFHFELAGNPFDMDFSLKTPISDPDFKGTMKGKIDLSALIKAVPIDSIEMAGLIDMSVSMAGQMSMLEKAQYDRFKASGNLNVSDMLVSMNGYPEFRSGTQDWNSHPNLQP